MIVMLYISARLRMHAVHTSPAHTCLYGGSDYLASTEWRSYTRLPFFEDSRQIPFLCDPNGVAILKLVLCHVR